MEIQLCVRDVDFCLVEHRGAANSYEKKPRIVAIQLPFGLIPRNLTFAVPHFLPRRFFNPAYLLSAQASAILHFRVITSIGIII
jgi:hypothetical protein